MSKRVPALIAGAMLCAAPGLFAQTAPGAVEQLSALAPANLAKSHAKPGFDITGTWQHGGGANNPFRFSPPEGFKLTPAGQKVYDAAKKAAAEGKVFEDDIGQCWPAGMPLIMTRVWPIAMVQIPTAIYMVSGFMNSVRTIFLDGRKHTDPDLVVPSFNGESIGHWEGDTLVVDTQYFVPDHHWLDNGIPATEDLHIIERMRLVNNGATLETEYTMTEPKTWVGEWKWTKRFRRVNDQDITEASCLPDLNAHMPSVQAEQRSR
jgi:hypothetical protein